MDLLQSIRRAGVPEEDIPATLHASAIHAYQKYQKGGNIGDIDFAVICAQILISMTEDGHPGRADSLNTLGVMLQRRYERTGEMSDIEEAIRITSQAVESSLEGDPNHAARLSNLGGMLQRRYEQTGQMSDLEEAIRITSQAVKSTTDHPDYAGWLTKLGVMLRSRYERIGQMSDLEEAIRMTSQAVESTLEDHPDRKHWINNLGVMLEIRYARTGQMSDLEEAIRVTSQAIESTPEDHPARTGLLSSLGINHQSRYERTGQISDLEEAIRVTSQAIELTPEDHPVRLRRLNNLGLMLQRRYEQTHQISDLEEAIRVAIQAVELTPQDHPDCAARLNNLGNKLLRRYERTGLVSDLEEAIQVTSRAVELTPEDHPDCAVYLYNYGINLELRYERMDQTRDLEEASACFQEAWNNRIAIPFNRIKAAARCLKLLFRQEKVSIATQLGKDVIDTLQTLNIRLLERDDQQYVVSTFAGIAADLGALLLESNRPEDALYHLEKGRTVILNELLDGKSDISHLTQHYPMEARRYKEIRDEINTPLRRLDRSLEGMQILKRRREAIIELDACIAEIRNIAGYERFLLSQTIADMQNCAAGGSIVVVNITEFRSDAIIISPEAITTLELSNISAADAKVWLKKTWTGSREERAKRNREYLEYLSWLWRSCVEKILDKVRTISDPAGRDPLRIWWVGSGLAASMPFHAAGIHSMNATENAYSRTVSSYAPSIKALAHAREQAKEEIRTRGSLLIATMPTTPAQENEKPPCSLLGVSEEKDKVLELSKGHLPAEHVEQPSVGQVIEELQHCSVAHFACHGSTDHIDPSKSRLILQKREEATLKQDWLTVGRISELNLSYARIAYLSACSTAQNRATRLSDEVIHVVSGFQVAGFPHVVGCLWPSIDRVCVEVADGFYSALFRQGESLWEKGEMALALREAVMSVRAEDMEMPLNWAQFVHYGP